MEKKIGKMILAISIIAFAVTGVAQAQTPENPIPITVPNFSFELDENGDPLVEYTPDITNDVLAWNEAPDASPDGPSPHVRINETAYNYPDGTFALAVKLETGLSTRPFNDNSRVWQMLAGETINEGDTYRLRYAATMLGQYDPGDVEASLIYDDEGALTEIHSETFYPTFTGEDVGTWSEVQLLFTVPGGAVYAGEDIGIQFKQDIRGWVLVDNVRLDLIPEPMTISLLGLGSLGLLRRRRI